MCSNAPAVQPNQKYRASSEHKPTDDLLNGHATPRAVNLGRQLAALKNALPEGSALARPARNARAVPDRKIALA
jgi:hypothetical protein